MKNQQVAIFNLTEVRALGDPRTLTGYAALFDTLSVDLWGFKEEIAPGAFAGSLKNDIRALWQHDTAQPLARTANSTLKLWEDSKGLAFEMVLPDTTLGRDAYTNVQSGLVDQMSFGFCILPDGEKWRTEEDNQIIRRLTNIDLREISPVTWAAYPATNVSARAAFGEPVIIPDWVRRGRADQPVDDLLAAEAARARQAEIRKRQRETYKILTGV